MSIVPNSRVSTPRAEKTKMIVKILAFLKFRGFHAHLGNNDLAQPSKQTFLAVWQFLLRQIDVAISLPPTGAEDLIIRVFDQLGFKEKISKSVLRSFNSPPSWQHSLYLMSSLIDSLQLEEDLLLPMLPPPVTDVGNTIPDAVLTRMVDAAKLADPSNSTNWSKHFQRLRSFECQWASYVEGDIEEDEVIRRQVNWSAAQARTDELDLKNLEHRIAEEEAKLKEVEASNHRLIEYRELISNFRIDRAKLLSELEGSTLNVDKRTVDLKSVSEALQSANKDIEQHGAERKKLEEMIESQECDREQVLQFQSEIEEGKEKLHRIRERRGGVMAKFTNLKQDNDKHIRHLRTDIENIENLIKTKLIPRLSAVDQTKCQSLKQKFMNPVVDDVAASAYIVSMEGAPNDKDYEEALLKVHMNTLLDELDGIIDDYNDQKENVISCISALKGEESQVRTTIQALKEKELEFEQSIQQTANMFQSAQEELEIDIMKMDKSISEIRDKLNGIDPSMAAEMNNLNIQLESLDMELESQKNHHQMELKNISDTLKFLEYKIEKRIEKINGTSNDVISAVKELLLVPVQSALLEGDDAYVLRRAVEEEAWKVLRGAGFD